MTNCRKICELVYASCIQTFYNVDMILANAAQYVVVVTSDTSTAMQTITVAKRSRFLFLASSLVRNAKLKSVLMQISTL